MTSPEELLFQKSNLCTCHSNQVNALKQGHRVVIPLSRTLTDVSAESRVSRSRVWISVPSWSPTAGFQRRETDRREAFLANTAVKRTQTKFHSSPPHRLGFLRPYLWFCSSRSPHGWIAGDKDRAQYCKSALLWQTKNRVLGALW